LRFQTIDLSDYQTFGLSDLRNIGPTPNGDQTILPIIISDDTRNIMQDSDPYI
jgi:hypothetical protein